MRRFFFSLAFLTLAAAGPMQAFGGDREIAEQIIQRLKVQRDAGTLKGFTLDLKVEEGIVLMRGRVSAEQQKASVMAATEGIAGVTKVVDEIAVIKKTIEPATAPDPVAAIEKPEAAPDPVAAVEKPEAAPETVAVVGKRAAQQAAQQRPAMEQPTEPAVKKDEGFSFREALSAAARRRGFDQPQMSAVSPAIATNRGEVIPAAASDSEATSEASDRDITTAVVRSLGQAQQQGQLRGFGVDVTTRDGDVWLSGRASNQEHKTLIMELAQSVSGVSNVIDDITVYAPKPMASTPARNASEKMAASNEPLNLKPVAVEPAARPASDQADQSPVAAAVPYRMSNGIPQQYAPAGYTGMEPGGQPRAGAGLPTPNRPMAGGPIAATAPYRMPQGAPQQHTPAGYGGAHVAGAAPIGQPVAAAPYAGGTAAPRYDQPYMPNYAWPGYAAYPNYAAVTYPQQYSPSAWPYIGPFYPYPQVPLGWRKVSLEWDDGWWFLDFTDR